jgi:hypothetical protein
MRQAVVAAVVMSKDDHSTAMRCTATSQQSLFDGGDVREEAYKVCARADGGAWRAGSDHRVIYICNRLVVDNQHACAGHVLARATCRQLR